MAEDTGASQLLSAHVAWMLVAYKSAAANSVVRPVQRPVACSAAEIIYVAKVARALGFFFYIKRFFRMTSERVQMLLPWPITAPLRRLPKRKHAVPLRVAQESGNET